MKERRRFDFADVDGMPGLHVIEFLAFTHPSEVDHMAVGIVSTHNMCIQWDIYTSLLLKLF